MSLLESAETQQGEEFILSIGTSKQDGVLKGRGDQHTAPFAYDVAPHVRRNVESVSQSFFERFMNNEKHLALFYLCTWFTLNVVITLYCKAVFSIHKFPYPMIMTTIHLTFTFAGVQLSALFGVFTPKPVSFQNLKTVLWFSVIFTLNIWASNASLLAVSVNLHQVVRTSIPLFTMAISIIVFRDLYPITLLPSILVVVVGVAATVWGDTEFDLWGMSIVIFGCVLSSLKGIMTKKTQVGAMGMSSMDLLRYLSPLAVIQLLILATVTGEVSKIRADEDLHPEVMGHLVALGIVAFFLNFVSFRNGALNDPLTLNIAGNVKQVLTSLMSIWIFGGNLSSLLAFGILLTAVGAFWYSQTMQKWRQAKRAAGVLPTPDLEEQQHLTVDDNKRARFTSRSSTTNTTDISAHGGEHSATSSTRVRLGDSAAASGGASASVGGVLVDASPTTTSSTVGDQQLSGELTAADSKMLGVSDVNTSYSEVEMYPYNPKRV
eukprot:Lankesteria_metandrocarpae@DN2562_c0_g1_i1.p1